MNFSVISAGKFWLVSLVFVCFSFFFAGVLFVSTTFAEIDPDTVVGVWLFDEGKGNVATDASENGLDGEFEGKPKWVEGKFGMALEFDGKSAYVQIPAHENPTEAITVSAWAKSAGDTWNQPGWIVEKRNAYIIHPNSGTKNIAWPVCMVAVGINPAVGMTVMLAPMILPNGTCTRPLIIARPVSGTSILMPKKRAHWIWLKIRLILILVPPILDLMTAAGAHALAQVLLTKF